MPHSIYHGVHHVTHSDFYYKCPDLSDPRATEIYWIIETESGKQFGKTMGYGSDKRSITAMKKSIDGFISATPVHRHDYFNEESVEMMHHCDGFVKAGIVLPEYEGTYVFGGPARTVKELSYAA